MSVTSAAVRRQYRPHHHDGACFTKRSGKKGTGRTSGASPPTSGRGFSHTTRRGTRGEQADTVKRHEKKIYSIRSISVGGNVLHALLEAYHTACAGKMQHVEDEAFSQSRGPERKVTNMLRMAAEPAVTFLSTFAHRNTTNVNITEHRHSQRQLTSGWHSQVASDAWEKRWVQVLLQVIPGLPEAILAPLRAGRHGRSSCQSLGHAGSMGQFGM